MKTSLCVSIGSKTVLLRKKGSLRRATVDKTVHPFVYTPAYLAPGADGK